MRRSATASTGSACSRARHAFDMYRDPVDRSKRRLGTLRDATLWMLVAMSNSASSVRPSTLLLVMSMLLGFTVLAFACGAAVGRYKYFPYNQLREAKQAAFSLWVILGGSNAERLIV